MKVIISRYSEDLSWLKDYNFDYLILNKGSDLSDDKSIKVPNIGNNQRDIFQYIVENYDSLPDRMVFIQGNPFDHCNQSKFNDLLENKQLTAIESFNESINGSWSRFNDGYEEINNSWYIGSHNSSHNQTCIWNSFDDFMNHLFTNYVRLEWIRFTPGSQYIITPNEVYNYPKSFWEYLMNILHKNSMTEGHIIERALWLILQGKYKLRQ